MPREGHKLSEETKRKIGEANKGKVHSIEARKNMSEAHKGKLLSEEHKRKIGESRKGYRHTAEAKRKISDALKGKAGGKQTEEHIRNRIEGRKRAAGDRGYWHSEETKTKIRESNEGQMRSEAAKQNMRGKKFSEEHRRKLGEAKRGEKAPTWKGGISFEPYTPEFNQTLKDVVRERDGWICQGCGKTQREEGKRLTVHHIDYDKANNDPKNLVAVCGSCNVKANFNREYWEEYYGKLAAECEQRKVN